MASSWTMVATQLFGGAIVAELPAALIDVSDIRQVPDNQEVFLYPDSSVSLVIEVLERIPEPNDLEAVKLHFEALAHDNDAVSSTMQHPFAARDDRGDRTPSPIILRGFQRIRKFNAPVDEDVEISLALFRVLTEGKSADVVVSASIPRSPGGGVGEKHATDITSEFDRLVSSLRIVSFDLFR